MKWYKLLTCFFIWFFALVNLLVGIYGTDYSVRRIITFDPASKGLGMNFDIILLLASFVSICVAIFAVISGIALIKFKKTALVLFIGTLAFWTASNAICIIAYEVCLATHKSSTIPPELILPGLIVFIISIAPSTVALILNIAYFKNRKHLFIK